MILGFHCIMTTYGFWLPNEPRGSYSTFVGSWNLLQFGQATKVNPRRSVAKRDYDHQQKAAMQNALKYPPVRFTGNQAKAVGLSISDLPYDLFALAILPDHVHLIVGQTTRKINVIMGHVKAHATRRLREHGWFADHSPWAKRAWSVYLNNVSDMKRAIAYVQGNPIRAGLKPQRWSVVQMYTA